LKNRLVLVFARLPREESHKKPLVGSLPRVEALYEKLFRRTLAVARSTGATVRLATHGDLPARLSFDGLEVVQQIGATFAERLGHATHDAFADGYGEVVVLGGDTPTLERTHLDDAFDALLGEGHRAALGPACDGGYYLLALNRFVSSIFTDVALGNSDTGRATEALLEREGFRVEHLAPLHDLDDEAGVRRIARTPGVLRDAALALLSFPSLHCTAFVAPPRRAIAATYARGPPRSAASL
jgi:glycosyltransferase A (GT-A) superfamily protein (DUF2064 family)